MMKHVITEVPFYRDRTLVPRLRRRRQDGHRADLGPEARTTAAGAWKRNLFNYSFVGWIGRETSGPTSSSRSRSRRARRRSCKVGHIEMPVMSFELFRRIATDAITTPDLLRARPA